MNRNTHTTLLALLVAACAQPETGIDHSVISGVATIPPLDLDEGEAAAGSNDSWEEGTALDLGPHGARYIRVNGTSSSFNLMSGDRDFYRFTPLLDGSMTVGVRWADDGTNTIDGDTGAVSTDAAVWRIAVFDTSVLDGEGNPTVIADGTTAGGFGAFELPVDVSANTTYAVQILGVESLGIDAYELVLGGFDPNDSTVYVGAWEKADPADRGLLLGGTTVSSFELDEESLVWSGEYTITDIRSVVTEEVGAEAKDVGLDTGDTGSADTGASDTGGADTGGTDGTDGSDGTDGTDGSDGTDGTDGTGGTEEDPKTNTTVNEKIATVYLHSGSFSGLTANIGPGVLYASEVVEVKLKTDEVTVDEVKDVAITLDTLVPVPVGWTTGEIEPNDLEIDGDDYSIVSGEAQVLPAASGPGLVDVVRGTLVFESADPSWGGDSDGYTFTVDEPLTAIITMDWEGADHNFDLNLNVANGELLAVGWDPDDVQPESIVSEDWGVVFEPGTEYTLLVLPWSGPAGEVPYSISIEWFAAP